MGALGFGAGAVRAEAACTTYAAAEGTGGASAAGEEESAEVGAAGSTGRAIGAGALLFSAVAWEVAT